MRKITKLYQNLAVNKKIFAVFIASVLTLITLISMAFIIQYNNIKFSQLEVPNSFFQNYDSYSISTVTTKVKSLILAVVDFRIIFITSITNSIAYNFTAVSPSYILNYTTQPNKISCFLLKPNNSTLSCSMHAYTNFILQQGWRFQAMRPIRRANIIYQSFQDQSDVMVKTISQNPDFQVNQTQTISAKMSNLRQGWLHISNFYKDQFGVSSENLMAFRTVLNMEKYRILVEMETYGSFISGPLSRVLFSNDTNAIVVSLDPYSPTGFKLIANFTALEPDLNYSKLLKLGYAKTKMNHFKTIHSYTQQFSSSFRLGSINYVINDEDSDKQFLIIVYSTSVSAAMGLNIQRFIYNLNSNLKYILTIFFALLMVVLTATTLKICFQIGHLLKNMTQNIKIYVKNPSQHLEITSHLESLCYSDNIQRPVMKNLENVIKNMEMKKRKFKSIGQKIETDRFPLNYLNADFLKIQGISDIRRFQNLKCLIQARQKKR